MLLAFVARATIEHVYASEPQTRAIAQYGSTAILDGRRYRAHTLGKDGQPEGDDVLVFRAGNFSSSSCAPYGFGEGPYWIRTQGDTIQFLAETTSPTHGTILWKGSVRGDRLEASYVWTKVRWYWTIRREYRMVGTREQ